MTDQFPLKNKLAQMAWRAFERELNHKLGALPVSEREEVKLELLSHLYDSALNDKAETEEARIIRAIDRLGAPAEYLEPLVRDIVLAQSTAKGHPAAILRSLVSFTGKGLLHLLFTLLFGFGYVIAIIIFVMAVMHLWNPDVGIWLSHDHSFSLSFEAQPDATLWQPKWFSLIGMGFGVGCYALLSKVLGLVLQKSRHRD